MHASTIYKLPYIQRQIVIIGKPKRQCDVSAQVVSKFCYIMHLEFYFIDVMDWLYHKLI